MTNFSISIVSDQASWINQYLPDLVQDLTLKGHLVQILHHVTGIPKGDFVFYLSCGQIVPPEILKRNRHNLVVHESALPQGRGWSPLTWQILEGKNSVPITLFEAAEKVDSGTIYLQDLMVFSGQELVDELRQAQAKATFSLCLQFVQSYPKIIAQGKEQMGEASYYPRRTPKDSELDLDKPLREQFNLLRVVDNEKYPAFFDMNGDRYILKIEKIKSHDSSC